MNRIKLIEAIHDINAKLSVLNECYYYNDDLEITQMVYNYYLDKDVSVTINENNILTIRNNK